MRFLVPLLVLLLTATSAAAVPPSPPTFSAYLDTCAHDRRGVVYDVYPQPADAADIAKLRVYRDGGLHMDRDYIPLGTNYLKWWHVPEAFEGLTFVFYATVVNTADEESFPSILQFVDITPCPVLPVIQDLFATAVDCEQAHLAWTQPTGALTAYRLNRVPESELWLYATDSKRQRIGISTESLTFRAGPPPPYYDDPPDGWPYPYGVLNWREEYFPHIPGETYCYWIESYIPYSLSPKSNVVCIEFPECP